MILCIFILSWIKFCLNQTCRRTLSQSVLQNQAPVTDDHSLMASRCHRVATETILRLIRDGEMGGRGYGGRGRGRFSLYLSLHCHHQNDICIKMGCDESHFKLMFYLWGTKSQDSVYRVTTFEEKGEPKRIRTEVPLLPPRPLGLTPYR